MGFYGTVESYNGCLFIFFDSVRKKQLRESYILKYGDKVEGMKLNQSLIDMSHSNPCTGRCYCFYLCKQTVGNFS